MPVSFIGKWFGPGLGGVAVFSYRCLIPEDNLTLQCLNRHMHRPIPVIMLSYKLPYKQAFMLYITIIFNYNANT